MEANVFSLKVLPRNCYCVARAQQAGVGTTLLLSQCQFEVAELHSPRCAEPVGVCWAAQALQLHVLSVSGHFPGWGSCAQKTFDLHTGACLQLHVLLVLLT